MSNPRPVFVYGCYRSGTSLLRLMLDAHSRITIPRETRYLTLLGPCVDRYRDLEDNVESQRSLIGDIGRILRRQGWQEVPDYAYVEAHISRWKLSEIAKAVNTHPCPAEKRKDLIYWGDKTPDYLKSVIYLGKAFSESRHLIVIRDGRDVAASARGLPFAAARNLEALALEWNESILNCLLAKRAFPESVLMLRYEELVSVPQATLQRVCQFLEVEYEKAMLRFYEKRAAAFLSTEPHHTRVANPVTPKSIGRYKQAFSGREIAKLEQLMYNGLAALGYEIDYPFQNPPSNVKRYFSFSSNFIRLVSVRGVGLLTQLVKSGLAKTSPSCTRDARSGSIDGVRPTVL